eukprot:5018666-Pyramimonas_sp.AAC.1
MRASAATPTPELRLPPSATHEGRRQACQPAYPSVLFLESRASSCNGAADASVPFSKYRSIERQEVLHAS